MEALLGWLYLNSDRRLAPLPFPVLSSSESDRQTQKMTLEGRAGIETTQKGPDLCATCVTRSGGYQQCVAALESRDVTIAYASDEDDWTSRFTGNAYPGFTFIETLAISFSSFESTASRLDAARLAIADGRSIAGIRCQSVHHGGTNA